MATSFESKDVVSIDPANPDQRTVLAADLAYPLGLATEGGNLYVGDFLAGQILQVAADGVTLDPPKLIAEGLQGPEGMALTGDGRLLVVESGANRLSIVDLASGQDQHADPGTRPLERRAPFATTTLLLQRRGCQPVGDDLCDGR